MIYKNEQQLLNIIKFTPSIFIITISIIITLFLYLETEKELENEKISIKNEYIKTNKYLEIDIEKKFDEKKLKG